MSNKTKNDLLIDIENLKNELREREDKLAKYDTIAMCADMGEEYKLIYDSYVKAGFPEEQAFELLRVTVERTINTIMYRSTPRVSYR